MDGCLLLRVQFKLRNKHTADPKPMETSSEGITRGDTGRVEAEGVDVDESVRRA